MIDDYVYNHQCLLFPCMRMRSLQKRPSVALTLQCVLGW